MESMTASPSILYDQEKGYENIKRLILKKLGLDGRYYRDSFFRRKIDQQLREKNFKSYWDYGNFLKKTPEEFDNLTTSLTVNYTTFFRDRDVFDHLKRVIFPDLLSKTKILRVMSAGCSYGHEPYTISMILHEILGPKIKDYTVSIYGIDIDQVCLAKARGGVYNEAEIEGIDSSLLRKYFTKTGKNYQVHDYVKKKVRFKYNDLTKSFNFKFLDIIICRNVFIYFSKAAQAEILSKFYDGMKNHGYLILGKTEMLPPALTSKFKILDSSKKVYKRV